MNNIEQSNQTNNDMNNYNVIQYAMDHIDDAVMITNKHNKVLYINNKLSEVTGYTFSELKSHSPDLFQTGAYDQTFYKDLVQKLEERGFWEGNVWTRSKSGEMFLQHLKVVGIKNEQNENEHYIYIYSDMYQSEFKKMQDFSNSTYLDILTKLPNRLFLENLFDLTVQHTEDSVETFAILFCRLDKFNLINEQYGFHFGDTVLKKLVDRLVHHLPPYCTLTRWSGVEFVILLEGISSSDNIVNFVKDIQKIAAETIILSDTEVSLNMITGISIYGEDGNTLTELLSKANKAMTYSQKNNKAFSLYQPEKMDSTTRSFILKMELEKAVERGEFEVYYQPLIELKTRHMIGIEALIRWNHPTEGLVAPGKFIPLAEQTGLIQEIGQWVVKKVCSDLQKWNKKGYKVNISINLSMNQFKDPFLVPSVKSVLEATEIDPSCLSFELTESAVLEDVDGAIFKVHQLKKLGVNIAIDDFGTGYSSLGYIIDFPINRIKIDCSFINVIGKNKKVKAIVSAIIAMGEEMDIEVVAEGIETEEQFNLMRKINCQIGQGYLFDRPLELEDLEKKWFIS